MGNTVERLFGSRVKAMRQARGLSQEDLAERLTAAGYPMTQTVVSKLESAVRPTSVGEVAAIAAEFDIPVTDLFATSDGERLRLELAGLASTLDAIRDEKVRLQARLAALDGQYIAIKADHRELVQQLPSRTRAAKDLEQADEAGTVLAAGVDPQDARRCTRGSASIPSPGMRGCCTRLDAEEEDR